MPIYVRYKRPGDDYWVFIPCRDSEEAKRWEAVLKEQGYIVERIGERQDPPPAY